jgi:hypothetical protein
MATGCRFRCMITTKVNPTPPAIRPMQADRDEELEHLRELLAEAEEMCLVIALEKHLEAQRAERELERVSRETGDQRGGGGRREPGRLVPDFRGANSAT